VRADKLKSHLKVCTKGKQIRQVEGQGFYRAGINSGKGLCPEPDLGVVPHDIESAIEFALKVVAFYNAKGLQGIKMDDKSRFEEEGGGSSEALHMMSGGLSAAIGKHKIPAGRHHHIVQQGSMVGHLREFGMLIKERTIIAKTQPTNEKETAAAAAATTIVCEPCAPATEESVNQTFIELGAGRGMLGLVVASISAASAELGGEKTELVMIERGSSRRTAETRIRNKVGTSEKKGEEPSGASVVKASDENSSSNSDEGGVPEYAFNPNNIKYRRIRVDLLNLHMPAVFEDPPAEAEEAKPPKVSILAKHLCGHASDLALRSLVPISHRLIGLAFAMCCHGNCRWEELVGRSYIEEELCGERGVEDFELLRKWGAGVKGVGEDGGEMEDEEHGNKEGGDSSSSAAADPPPASSYTGASQVCQAPAIKALGITRNELCRISCRVIDYCRLKFVENELGFGAASSNRDNGGESGAEHGKTGAQMVYYCEQNVTPQNLLVIASRKTPLSEEEGSRDAGKASGKRVKHN
jgi:tRNA:m4X modification enzyme